MVHERELFVEAHEGEPCNGFRPHRWYSNSFEFSLRIPRSLSGNFYPVLLALIRSESEERTKLFHLPIHNWGLIMNQFIFGVMDIWLAKKLQMSITPKLQKRKFSKTLVLENFL